MSNIAKETILTQEYVKSLFDYREGFLYWKIKPHGKINIGTLAGTVSKKQKRRYVKINKKRYGNSRLVFLYHEGYLPECVDHRDRNCLNDKIENLRAASKSQNNSNKGSKSNSSSKYLGVSFSKRDNVFCAKIGLKGFRKHLGSFKNEKDAALAYNEAAVKIHGDFANLNIV